MLKKEKFPYDLEMGAVMDFVDGRFMLVLKDEFWTDEEIAMLQSGLKVYFCYTNDIAIFVLEGGDIDSSDFYFNIQECEDAQKILNADTLEVEVFLLNQDNEICFSRKSSLNAENTKAIQSCLQKQKDVQFMPGEYDVNVEGLQSAYEPFELLKYAKCEMKV
jgi:hypothetical protein